VKSYEELINGKICPAKYKTVFKLDVENQPIVFTKQSIVFISSL